MSTVGNFNSRSFGTLFAGHHGGSSRTLHPEGGFPRESPAPLEAAGRAETDRSRLHPQYRFMTDMFDPMDDRYAHSAGSNGDAHFPAT